MTLKLKSPLYRLALSELQEYRQQLLSIEQACKSALSQMSTRAAS
jgi:hypothetical protein